MKGSQVGFLFPLILKNQLRLCILTTTIPSSLYLKHSYSLLFPPFSLTHHHLSPQYHCPNNHQIHHHCRQNHTLAAQQIQNISWKGTKLVIFNKSMSSYSVTYWWSKWEVIKEVMLYFADIEPFCKGIKILTFTFNPNC